MATVLAMNGRKDDGTALNAKEKRTTEDVKEEGEKD
jgi:hypothetical protein